MLTVGSLFSGIGGFDRGLENAGFQIEWQVENNEYCREVLKKHWPKVPCHYDITKIDWHWIPRVDLVCAGFPCQPFSLAGKQRGEADDRYLWPEVVRCLSVLRPTWFLGENVPGLLHLGIERLYADLEALGYQVTILGIPACAVEAPHIRERIWIIGYHHEGWRCPADESFRKGSRGEIGDNALLSHPVSLGQQEQREPVSDDSWRELGRVRTEYGARWASEPKIQRVVDGFPGRVDRLRGLGNAVVPQIVEALGRMILEADCDPKMSQPCRNATGKGGDRQ